MNNAFISLFCILGSTPRPDTGIYDYSYAKGKFDNIDRTNVNYLLTLEPMVADYVASKHVYDVHNTRDVRCFKL